MVGGSFQTRRHSFSFREGRDFFAPVFLLGLTSIAAQIILLREFLSFFYGNELILGLILANWMLLTALGAYLGKNAEHRIHHLAGVLHMMIWLAVLPFVLVFMMYYLRNIVFSQGAMVNLLQIYLSSLVLLLPFCLVSGLLFTLLSELTSRQYQRNLISRVYAWESFGSLVGGIVFNLVLIWFLKTFESLSLLIFLNMIFIFFVSWRCRCRRLMVLSVVLGLGVVCLNVLFNPDLKAREFLYRGHTVEYYKSSPYGNIVVTQKDEQINFYENQVLLFSSRQPTLDEESVHFPMIQHEDPKRVMLLSGGTPGVIHELLKYDIQRLDYVEINPWLLDAVRKYSDVYDDPRVRVINRDARLHIRTTGQKYDVVLIQLPEPSTVQLNRFYTRGFYQQLKDCLDEGAVVSFSVSGSANYMSEEERELNGSLFHTLKTAFSNVIIIPGTNLYYVASDNPVSYQVASMAERRNLKNDYVNPYYLDDALIQRRGEMLLQNLPQQFEVNRDFKPITYYLKVRQWLSYFEFNYWLPLLMAGFFILYILVRLHPVNLGMFSAGFAGASIEVVLLVAFQILYGYVYSMVGVIVTVFMAGLAAGTWYREKIIPGVSLTLYYRLLWVMGGYTLLLPLILLGMRHWSAPAFLLQAIFVVMMFAASMLTGMVFSLASQLRLRRWIITASEIYSVDLLGAGIGTFIVSVYLIPLLGLLNVLVVIAAVCLLAGLLARLRLGAA
jgi:spermidine synthase